MICPLCGNKISDIYNENFVDYGGKRWRVASAVISKDKQDMPCEFCEKAILDIDARQRREKNEKELTGNVE